MPSQDRSAISSPGVRTVAVRPLPDVQASEKETFLLQAGADASRLLLGRNILRVQTHTEGNDPLRANDTVRVGDHFGLGVQPPLLWQPFHLDIPFFRPGKDLLPLRSDRNFERKNRVPASNSAFNIWPVTAGGQRQHYDAGGQCPPQANRRSPLANSGRLASRHAVAVISEDAGSTGENDRGCGNTGIASAQAAGLEVNRLDRSASSFLART